MTWGWWGRLHTQHHSLRRAKSSCHPPTGSHCLQVIRYKAFLRDLQAVFREQSPTPYSNRRRKPGPETVSERSHLCGQAE